MSTTTSILGKKTPAIQEHTVSHPLCYWILGFQIDRLLRIMGNSKRHFLRQFIRHPGRVGAVVPSSQRLINKMMEWPDLENAGAVVEYGSGTGVFTRTILDTINGDCRFFGIEIDPRLVALSHRRLPEATIYRDSVANVEELCRKEGIDQVDCVVAGLPWATFSASTQGQFMDALMKVLKPGGQFVTFTYTHSLLLPAGQRFRQLLPEYFGEVSRSQTVWLNLPPAFIYQCRR